MALSSTLRHAHISENGANSVIIRGSCQETFPSKLFKILMSSEACGYSSIISWLPHGRTFKVHDDYRFEKEIMTKYFNHAKFDSFKRQLHLYGFQKVGKAFTDSGAYFHEFFSIGRFDLCEQITRSAKPSSAQAMITGTPNFCHLLQ